jgi:hypothetical protein
VSNPDPDVDNVHIPEAVGIHTNQTEEYPLVAPWFCSSVSRVALKLLPEVVQLLPETEVAPVKLSLLGPARDVPAPVKVIAPDAPLLPSTAK